MRVLSLRLKLQIERQINALEAAILAVIEGDAELANRFTILTSIPGVSNITAFAC